jgi:7-dehydrocholesterol reductase
MLATEPSEPVQRKSKIFKKTEKIVEKSAKNWGRSWNISNWTVTGCVLLLVACPILVLFFWVSCNSFQCNIISPVEKLFQVGFKSFTINYFPKPSVFGFQLYYGWLVFQALLYTFLPASIGYGQMTPAGHTLPYVVNGLRAWIITHVLFLIGSFGLGLFKASIIADHFGSLMIAANSYGYFLTMFSYCKAHYFSSHPNDRKFSNSRIYDFFMGIELNPRFGNYFDFKLFHNGRPGIVAWTLINLSFAAAQYNEIGRVTNSMILLNIFHALYVVDFFYHEVLFVSL